MRVNILCVIFQLGVFRVAPLLMVGPRALYRVWNRGVVGGHIPSTPRVPEGANHPHPCLCSYVYLSVTPNFGRSASQ